MTADQHENLRAGTVEGVELTRVWDLEGVNPLFRVPSCVVFAKHSGKSKGAPISPSGIPGYVFEGTLPRFHVHWSEVASRLKARATRWYYVKLQGGKARSRSALSQTHTEALSGRNAYADRFRQGATIVPRNFFFVDLYQSSHTGEIEDCVFALKTAVTVNVEAKVPWKGKLLDGRASALPIASVTA